MLSIIMTSRVKDNPDSNIHNMLTSLVNCGANKDNCELLIKYDTDDDEASKVSIENYPVNIKRFCWSRGEGRHGIHLDHFYLFAQRSMKSRFALLCADDFTFTRVGFINDILSIKDEFCFVGPRRPRAELYAGHWKEKYVMEVWKHNEGVSLPCVSVKCIEVLQNYGWQCNGDNWITLLHILMFEKDKIDLWRSIDDFYIRNPTSGSSGYGYTYNNMEMDGSRNPENEYYYKLVEQQAKNLFLNIAINING